MKDDKMSKTVFEKMVSFFTEFYEEDLFKFSRPAFLGKSPSERSLTVNYECLEKFDPDVADLLISQPQEILDVSKKVIETMTTVEVNVRFENVNNEISLFDLTSRDIGSLISVEGRVKSVSKVTPKIDEALFECNGCMRIHKIPQEPMKPIREPMVCSECGYRSFKLIEGSSSYIDFQKCVLTNLSDKLGEGYGPVNLTVILMDDLVRKLSVREAVRLTGIYAVSKNSKDKKFEPYLLVNHIEYLPEVLDDIFEPVEYESSVSRNSLEYTNWRNQVFQRDKVCQCCGLDKRLHAHHIFGYEEHPELAYDVNNGIILCQFCHDKYHSVYGLKDINPVKFAKFIRRFSNGGALDDD